MFFFWFSSLFVIIVVCNFHMGTNEPWDSLIWFDISRMCSHTHEHHGQSNAIYIISSNIQEKPNTGNWRIRNARNCHKYRRPNSRNENDQSHQPSSYKPCGSPSAIGPQFHCTSCAATLKQSLISLEFTFTVHFMAGINFDDLHQHWTDN